MDQLDKFEQKQVAKISELQARSNELQAKAYELVITSDEDVKTAREVIKEINAHKKEVSEKRLAYTQPLNNIVAQLIAKEKEVLLPLDEGKTDISDKIIAYSEEVERKRKEEAERIDTINDTIIDHYNMQAATVEEVDTAGANLKKYFEELSEADKNNPTLKVSFMTTVGRLTDRKNQIIEDARIEAERVRQAEEQAKLDAEREKQTAEENRLAEERLANEEAKRQIEADKLQMQRDKEELERQKEIQKAEAEALKLEKAEARKVKAAPKTNQVTTTKFEITDESAVDRIYCSPDEKLIREAIKLGVKNIAGVRIYEEKKVR